MTLFHIPAKVWERNRKIIPTKQHSLLCIPCCAFPFPCSQPRVSGGSQGWLELLCLSPAGVPRIRVGIKGWEFLTRGPVCQQGSHRTQDSLGGLWGSPHTGTGQGRARSPGHVPAALFGVTAQSDPWKSWRGSELQPCCPARCPTAPFHHTAPLCSLGPWQDPIFLSFLWLQEQELSLCLCQCVVGRWADLCGNIRVGSPLVSLCLQHGASLGWSYGRGRGRQ